MTDSSSPFSFDAPPACRLSVPAANSGLHLLMQSGAGLACTTGIPISRFLLDECAVPPNDYARIDVLMLDGKPVDDPSATPVPNHSRLALAAGLPGVAGIAMRSNSAVRGLRPGITHQPADNAQTPPQPQPGHIELALFSLALPLLAQHFLSRGVLLPAGKLLKHLRPGLAGNCRLDGAPVAPADVRQHLSNLAPSALVLFTAASIL